MAKLTQNRKTLLVADRSGMSLIEVIVAFAILAIVMAIVVAAFTTSANVTSRSNAFTRAGEAMDAAIANGDAPEAKQPLNAKGNDGLKLEYENATGEVTAFIKSEVYEYTDEGSGISYRILGK
jgi:prepilin-type N-terminal cleavage/methylation domain-containing protein